MAQAGVGAEELSGYGRGFRSQVIGSQGVGLSGAGPDVLLRVPDGGILKVLR